MLSKSEIGHRDLIFYYNGNVYKKEWLDNLPLEFNGPLYVGIDQSSSSTGICIVDYNEDNIFICEFVRGDLSVRLYMKALKSQLFKLLSGKLVGYFVFEKHGVHITPLESVINDVTDSIKSLAKYMFLRDTETCGVPPVVWRSGFLIGSEYEGRFTREQVKLACVQEAVKLNPDLSKYIKYCQKDYDGFEAYGIIKGFKQLNFAEDGRRIVNTTMPRNYFLKPNYTIHKCSKPDIENSIQRLTKSLNLSNPLICYSNPNIFLEEAINRVSSLSRESIIIYRYCSEYCKFVFELGEPISKEDTILVCCRR